MDTYIQIKLRDLEDIKSELETLKRNKIKLENEIKGYKETLENILDAKDYGITKLISRDGLTKFIKNHNATPSKKYTTVLKPNPKPKFFRPMLPENSIENCIEKNTRDYELIKIERDSFNRDAYYAEYQEK